MRLLFVGRLVRTKGARDAIRALGQVRDLPVTLDVVGDGFDRAACEKATADLQLTDRVTFHGWIPREQVTGLYQAADAFVLPSLKEPYGTVYGEAMAYSLPVVGWRAGNLPYLADHEREGLLVEPGDVIGLSGALRRLATDTSFRACLGAAAQTRALARPTWEESGARFFGAVREAALQSPVPT